jgi:tetratricopeptide (TPR) repeat protein
MENAALKCPSCGEDLAGAKKFCPHCGAKLEGAAGKTQDTQDMTGADEFIAKADACKDDNEAIAILSEGIKRFPNNAELVNRRARCFRSHGDYEAAIAGHTRAIQLEPSKAGYYLSRGNTYNEMGEYDQALADMNRSIELDPNEAEAYLSRAKAFNGKENPEAEARDYNKAIQIYSSAVELDPNDYDAYHRRGLVYCRKEQWNAAIRDYTHAIELYSTLNDGSAETLAIYYNDRGRAYCAKEQGNAAIRDFTRAIELCVTLDDAETLAWYYDNRGLVLWAGMKEKEKALADFEQAVRLDPGNKEYQKHRDEAKGCFITTAVCGSLGKPDDCRELSAFRAFRDTWLAKQPGGRELIGEYYRIAPRIVAAIDAAPNHCETYRNIWNDYLVECMSFIDKGRFEECRDTYLRMVHDLKGVWI